MNLQEATNLLRYISPDIGRDEWVKVAMGLRSEFGEDAIDLFDDWSQGGNSYDFDDMASTWNSIDSEGGIKIGTVIHMAQQNGYKHAAGSLSPAASVNPLQSRYKKNKKTGDEKLHKQKLAANLAQSMWDKAKELDPNHPHPYLIKKGIVSIVSGNTRQNGDNLLIPLRDEQNKIWNVERIDPNGNKKGLSCGKRKGLITVIKGKNNDAVVIAEGFATGISINAATHFPVLISFGKSNLQSAAKIAREQLPNCKIIIAGDVGSEKDAINAAIAVNGYFAIPDMDKNGSDFNDLHQSKDLDAVKQAINSCKKPDNSSKKSSDWDAIIPLNTELPEVKKFNYDMLPDGLAPWVKDESERMQCPPDFIATAAMFSASVLIGRKIGIHPKAKDDWLVIPNIWGAAIGRPSTKKSPAISIATKPLTKLASKAQNDHQSSLVQYDIDDLQQKTEKKILDDELKDAIKSGVEFDIEQAKNAILSFSGKNKPSPTEKRFIINDVTVEKLGELLNENTNGIGLIRDELTGWLKSLDREDKSSDRAFYLESFNGNSSFTYDRIGRGTIHIESNTLSVFGGIQPAKLRPYIWNAINQNSSDDGLIQRLQLMTYPDEIKNWVNVDRVPDKKAQEVALNIYHELNELPSERDDYNNVVGVRFNDAAQKIFNDWYQENENKIRATDIHPSIASHLGKYGSLFASLSLIINEIEEGHNKAITERSAKKALRWLQYLESHAMRLYSDVTSPTIHMAQLILNKKDQLPDGFTHRELVRKCWSGLTGAKSVKEALNELVESNYLKMKLKSSSKGGSNSVVYIWNPNI